MRNQFAELNGAQSLVGAIYFEFPQTNMFIIQVYIIIFNPPWGLTCPFTKALSFYPRWDMYPFPGSVKQECAPTPILCQHSVENAFRPPTRPWFCLGTVIFDGFDPMGFITIIHHRVGEYFLVHSLFPSALFRSSRKYRKVERSRRSAGCAKAI